MAELTVNKPEFHKAIADGLKWFCLHWCVPFVWPELVNLIQSALNIHAQSSKTELEVMLEMHKMANSQIDLGVPRAEIDWQAIEQAACQTLPPCASYIHSLSQLVAKSSGGPSGQLLMELNRFSQYFVKADRHGGGRTLGAEYIQKLVGLQHEKGQYFPFVELACMEANLSCSPAKVVPGEATTLLAYMV
eukprot:2243349-Amphidinium_carterae.1